MSSTTSPTTISALTTSTSTRRHFIDVASGLVVGGIHLGRVFLIHHVAKRANA
jgi:hypothetical protein